MIKGSAYELLRQLDLKRLESVKAEKPVELYDGGLAFQARMAYEVGDGFIYHFRRILKNVIGQLLLPLG